MFILCFSLQGNPKHLWQLLLPQIVSPQQLFKVRIFSTTEGTRFTVLLLFSASLRRGTGITAPVSLITRRLLKMKAAAYRGWTIQQQGLCTHWRVPNPGLEHWAIYLFPSFYTLSFFPWGPSSSLPFNSHNRQGRLGWEWPMITQQTSMAWVRNWTWNSNHWISLALHSSPPIISLKPKVKQEVYSIVCNF